MLPDFPTVDEEVRFLRGLVAVQSLADEILEDCLSRQLGLAAALDVYLSQCARMMHATTAFVQVMGSREPVITRVFGAWGPEVMNLEEFAQKTGAIVLENGRRTLFVSALNLGGTHLGAIGFTLPGVTEQAGQYVLPLVCAMAETLDTALLAFVALAEGRTIVERIDELNERLAFRPNSRVGKYELVIPLGTGGMAQVMVAKTLGPSGVKRLVAIKRILPHLSADPSMVEQFLDEARVGLRLSHPNLVTFYDFGQAAGGGFYIAMELIRGVDFDHVIYAPPGRLEPHLASGILVQALQGLHAAHELRAEDQSHLGLVHRDLSPHNLMVGFDGRVKVLDFGVAKARNQKTVTLPGIVKGKPLYMSPEQAVGDRVDRRSDLFSMGLILYEALTGTRPFARGDDKATMEAIVSQPLVKDARVSRELWEVLDRALAKNPEQRYRTALEMVAHLTQAATPASEQVLARHVASTFPHKLAEFTQWEKA